MGLIPAEGQGIFLSISLCMLQLIFISVNFCFSFVLNSLVYITIPKNKN